MTEAQTKEIIKRAFLAKTVNRTQIHYWEKTLILLNETTMNWVATNSKRMRNKKMREAVRNELNLRKQDKAQQPLTAQAA